jgi:hypothetical protein
VSQALNLSHSQGRVRTSYSPSPCISEALLKDESHAAVCAHHNARGTLHAIRACVVRTEIDFDWVSLSTNDCPLSGILLQVKFQ